MEKINNGAERKNLAESSGENLEQWLEDLVRKNIFALPEEPSKRTESRCIDGRYQEEVKPLAMPGADAGDLLKAFSALRKLNIDPATHRQAVLEAALKTAGGINNFHFHTDEHAKEQGLEEGMGCGHLKLALQNPEEYGLAKEDMEFVFEQLKSLRKQGAKEDTLSGPHLEKAIVIVESATHSVAPRDDDQEVFVFHETLHQERLEKLANNIIEALYEKTAIDRESLISALAKTSQEQIERTIQKLAPNLPVFHVSVLGKSEIQIRREK